jgi:S1-C subfamily serine protease
MDRTLTQGHITYANRVVNGAQYHQFSSQLGVGSSGSPLIDRQGSVIGMVSKSIQGINSQFLALTVEEITTVSSNNNLTIPELFSQQHIPQLVIHPYSQLVSEVENNNDITNSQAINSGDTVQAYMELNTSDVYSMSIVEGEEIFIMLVPKYDIDLRYFDIQLVNGQSQQISQGYLSRYQGKDVLILRRSFNENQNVYIQIGWSNQYPWPIGANYDVFITNV